MKFRTMVIDLLVLSVMIIPLVTFARSFDGVLRIAIAVGLLSAFFRLCWIVVISTIRTGDIEYLERVISRLTAEKAELLDKITKR